MRADVVTKSGVVALSLPDELRNLDSLMALNDS